MKRIKKVLMETNRMMAFLPISLQCDVSTLKATTKVKTTAVY